jgi:serine protease AprX
LSVTWARVRRAQMWPARLSDHLSRHRVRLVLATVVVGTVAAGAALTTAMADSGGSGPLPDLASVERVVGAQQSWQYGATGAGVDVAVLDTGVTPVPGLSAAGKVVQGPDLSFDSQDPSLAHLDSYGHGTAMAGIIAANDGYRGVAPDARVVSVKVGAKDGAVDVSQIIAGIDWVVQHAHDSGLNIRVLNLSLGTTSTQSYVLDPLAHAAENAWRHGIVVVVAGGNDGSTSTALADPATDPYVLAVGAEDPMGTISNSDDVVPSYSARGTFLRHVDVVAPGSYVMGLLSPGSLLSQQFPGAVFGRFFRGSGTSQAAAITSGAVADILSAHPGWTPDQVRSALTSTARDIATNSTTLVGNGLINIPAAISTRPSTWSLTSLWPKSTGLGSLEAARGNAHVAIGGVTLTGEQDVFGNPWVPATIAPAEESLTAWSGGTYNGAPWAADGWTVSTSGALWSSVTWSSVTWSSVTWSSVTWSSVTWSSVTWSSVTWSGSAWLGSSWA